MKWTQEMLDKIDADAEKLLGKMRALPIADIRLCKICGTNPNDEPDDFIYPLDRERTRWSANCVNPWCDNTIEAGNYDDAIKKWDGLNQQVQNNE